MAKKLTKPIALFFTVFAVLVAALLYFGALDITTSAAWNGITIAEKFDGGGGSKVSPFEIANGEQLANLAKTVNEGETYSGQFFKLTANIDLGENEWTPIGGENNYFEGTFDGNGYTVSNFTINKPEESYIGLFGYNKGTIMNLGVEKAEISGSVRVGGVCGHNYGTIKNCYNTGAVSGTYNVGGVCGENYGTIQNCYNTGAVSGTNNIGGVCGYNNFYCTIKNCYNTGAVSGNGKTSSSIGGVCGYNNSGCTIKNCYNTGAVSTNSETSSYIGGVCGYNDGPVTKCYYNKDFCAIGGINGSDVDGSATGLTSEELCNGTLDNLAGFEKSVWEPGKSSAITPVEEGSRFGTITYTYPSLKGVGSAAETKVKFYNFGTSDSPDWQIFTEITTADQFKAIGEDETSWGKNYVLGNDIVFEDGTELTPIGNSAKPFTGKFSGNGHTVSNFKINKPNINNIGLFGKNKGTIMNLGVENAEINGYNYVGGVCGYNNAGGTIQNCYNTDAVNGESTVGGVCGFNDGVGTIRNCYNTGAVKGEATVGGVCGDNQGNTIRNCYNTGAVKGESKVGGVCGYKYYSSTIQNCYNTGAVSGSEDVGGVCGYSYGSITNCYYNTDIFASSGIGDGDGSATGLTTEQLCNGTLDKLAGFVDSVWKPGESSDVKTTEEGSRFGTKTYTYPSLKGVGSAAETKVKFYNFGTSDSPDWQIFTEITTADQFKAIGEDKTSLGKNYVLGDNIDLGGEEITPIGDSDNLFTGKFSGNGHTVSNFTISKPDESHIGLFTGNSGTIMNLGVENAEISGYYSIGGVCGENYGTIKNCYNTGAVSGTHYVGGVCGDNTGTIEGCYNAANVSGKKGSVGGVCGNNIGTITNSYNIGNVSGDEYVGGVCGYNNSETITNCYNAGTVNGNYSTVGNVCGYSDGTITNCYYNKDICAAGGIGLGSGSAAGLTSLQMTDGNALTTMGFGADWSKKDIDKENSIAYYPDLAVFADDKPSVKYETKLVIEPADKDAEYKYGDEVKFNVSALVKFDGMADFAADTTAVTKSKGSFKVTVDGEPVVDSMDIFDNTTAEAVIPSIKIIGDKTFMLVYDGTNSAYIASGTATCKVSIAKLDLTADDFTFTEPTTLIYDGMAKEATVTANDGITGVGEIKVKYYAGDTETQPINAGDYTVKIDVAEGDFCKSAHDLTADDWKFTIAKETQTITADDVTLTYGETAKITASTDRDGAISYAVKTGDDVISVAADGTITALKAGTATVEITAAETANYAPSTKTVNVTVSKVSVTIIANSYTIKVGDNLPAYDYEVTGLVNGDALPIDVTISCVADGKTAGEFPITVSGAADSANYTFSYTNGTLIVSNKETQTITADDVTLTYGETAKITASTNGDGAISYAVTAGSDVISVAADGTITALKAGTATVEITAAETDTYAKAVKAVTVTVNKAAVTITAKSYTIKVGAALPDFDYEVAGLVNGEALPITVTISCTAADSGTAGTFPITVSGAADSDNYTFSYLNGTLTIGEKEPVSTPVFSPASGTTFTSSQKITITCATEGAAIYYTTDGTEPTTASTLYNGAFTITATTTIKAIAVKEGMADSAAATAAYTKRSSSGGSVGTGGGSSRPTTPTEPENPSVGGSAKSWSDIAADFAKLANGSEVTIQLNGNTAVPVEIIKKIADTDSKVTFVIDSVFTWVVDGAKITVPAAADLSFIRTASQKHDGLRGIEGTQFKINNTGVPAGLEIAFKSEHAGKFANLYKSVDGKLVFVTCAKLGVDGKVLLPNVTEEGDYIAMLCEFSNLLGDMSNDGILNAMDASAILKDIVGLESGANPLMADFNGDGNVNAMDASAILKRIVGLI